jgi:hypothetical protein
VAVLRAVGDRDRSWRNVNDRPRNASVRTATGIAAMTFYAVLWVEGGNDVIADKLSVPLYTITWTARVLVFAGLAVEFYLTRRICLGLQRKDQELLEHGLETGIIRQLPHGEFVEIHRPLTEEERAVLEAKKVPALMPAPGAEDHNGVPAPSRAAIGRLRARANRAFAETIVAETNGHGNGHRAVEAVAQVTAGSADGGRRGGRLMAWPLPVVRMKVISSGANTIASPVHDPRLIANSPHHMQQTPKQFGCLAPDHSNRRG